METILFKHVDVPDINRLGVYRENDGYEALRKTVTEMAPADVTKEVGDSGLAGRGGAGFPTGRKWSFIPKGILPTYLVINADESEPGAFKDRELMERNPHQLLEGVAIASYAIGCRKAFIYIRGEYLYIGEILDQAIAEATVAGCLGTNIFASGYSIEIVVHRGAGAYICGEESALLDSLEGYRGFPRLRPPFPAVKGLYNQPTVINNVETIANVPFIIHKGPAAFRAHGTEGSPGTKVCSISGPVNRPGNYEVDLGTPFRVLLDDLAGGMKSGKKLKAYIPGGASAPMLPGTDEYIDVPMSYEGYRDAGSSLGSASFILIPDDVCILRAQLRISEFFAHESCGKCIPCREGTPWLAKTVSRIERGEGREEDLPLLLDICDNILGRSFCALGDFSTSNIVASIKYFFDEYEEHISRGRCPYGPPLAAAAGHAAS
ncbi:MAG: NADH-quinone oxidoreductase subunit NuoF [Chloroflexota bacterium]|nr:MAG: NADH-quinone oxidoreductase subunit F [Chloroflexota bacterium]